jgi:flagellin
MSTINDMVNLNTGMQQVQNNVLQKISSGQQINQASDDASGLAISDMLRTQSSGLSQSIENANSGIAMANIADGALAEQKDILGEIKRLTIQANTATTSADGRESIANQINKYLDQYEQISDQTNYNGTNLLKTSGDATADDLTIASADGDVSMQKADTTSVSDDLRTLMSDFLTNPDSRDQLMKAVDTGLDTLNSYASEFGSATNQLESMARNYMTAQTNTESAKSTILDADIAKMVSDFSSNNINSIAGSFVQSQSNAIQSNVLRLLA